MAKRSEDRFSSMDEFVAELEACLDELDPASEQATMIARRPAAQQRPRRKRRRRGALLWPLAALVAILAVAALAALGAMALRDNGGGGSAGATNTSMRLSGIGAYDPEGGDGEHDDDAYKATDGDPATYWTTEEYNDFANTKSGVGLVLDAGKAVQPATMTVSTDTPGYTAEIRADNSREGPFDRVVGDSRTVEERTTFTLHDSRARYFVLWITALDGVAHANEVRARS
jgi:hypothetical protein